jgi:hypothetical protein
MQQGHVLTKNESPLICKKIKNKINSTSVFCHVASSQTKIICRRVDFMPQGDGLFSQFILLFLVLF